MDGQPAEIGCKYAKGTLTFGNGVPGKELSWVRIGNILISAHTICTNISWNQLNDMGYIFGTNVSIEGMSFRCRSLKVGSQEGNPNEWDKVLDATGKDNSLWHWSDPYFWGQDTFESNTSYRVVRGHISARYWNGYLTAAFRDMAVGFRPILEILNTDILVSDSILETKLRA